jgi:hypothetical protein
VASIIGTKKELRRACSELRRQRETGGLGWCRASGVKRRSFWWLYRALHSRHCRHSDGEGRDASVMGAPLLGTNLFAMTASRRGGDQIEDLAACWGAGRLSSAASTWSSPSACRPGHRGENEDDDLLCLFEAVRGRLVPDGLLSWAGLVGLRSR